jgi:hypothetical protein
VADASPLAHRLVSRPVPTEAAIELDEDEESAQLCEPPDCVSLAVADCTSLIDRPCWLALSSASASEIISVVDAIVAARAKHVPRVWPRRRKKTR